VPVFAAPYLADDDPTRLRRGVGRPGDPLLDLAEFGEGLPEVVVGSEAEVARWSLSGLVGEMLLAGDVVALSNSTSHMRPKRSASTIRVSIKTCCVNAGSSCWR
jgi:hypothetical protein